MTSLLTIKVHHKLLQNKLTALTTSETPTEFSFERPPSCKAIFEKQLASELFDDCNDAVKNYKIPSSLFASGKTLANAA